MAELTQQERLQPSLLDRLTDDDPHHVAESRDSRVLSLERLRECVLRDLVWLMNTDSLNQPEAFESLPEVRRSVINYGIPAFSGLTASTIDVTALERQITQAILDFEPRILPESVRVRARLATSDMSQNALRFEIEGDLWAQPLPLQLYLQTEVDLENGSVSIVHATR